MGYQLPVVPNTITIAGHVVPLGGSQNLAASDLTNGTTGSGDIVLETSPTLNSPTFEGTVSGLTADEVAGLAAVATGTLPNARLSAVPNSALADSSITIAGHVVSLGGSQALAAFDLTNGTTGSGAISLQTSPAFAGTPSAPTAGVGANSTQIATTNFVQSNQLGVNVKAFGATGSGSSDDAAAINNAVSALGSAGGIVYFPPGTYLVQSAPITILPKVHFVGSGRGATIISLAAGSAATGVNGGAKAGHQGGVKVGHWWCD